MRDVDKVCFLTLPSPRLTCSATLSRTAPSSSQQYKSSPRPFSTSCPNVVLLLPPCRHGPCLSLLIAVGSLLPPLLLRPMLRHPRGRHIKLLAGIGVPVSPAAKSSRKTVKRPWHRQPGYVRDCSSGGWHRTIAPLPPLEESRVQNLWFSSAGHILKSSFLFLQVPGSWVDSERRTASSFLPTMPPIANGQEIAGRGRNAFPRISCQSLQGHGSPAVMSQDKMPSAPSRTTSHRVLWVCWLSLWCHLHRAWRCGSCCPTRPVGSFRQLDSATRFGSPGNPQVQLHSRDSSRCPCPAWGDCCPTAKDAIEPVPPAEMESGFYSPYFIAPKKGSGLWTILDLWIGPFTSSLFKMLTQKCIIRCIQPQDWFAAVDLKDAYFHVFMKVAEGAAWQARVGPHGQHFGCFIHQPAGRSSITLHVTTRPPSLPLESDVAQVAACHPHSGGAQSHGWRALTTAYFPWTMATPSPSGPANLESIRGSSGGPVVLLMSPSTAFYTIPWPRPPSAQMHLHTAGPGSTQVCVSPSEPSRTDTVQGQGGRGTGLAGCALLDHPDLVFGTHAPGDSPSLVHPSEERPSFSGARHHCPPCPDL